MSSQIGVRMQPQDIRLLKEVCKARGEDVSDFVRRAIKMELARLSFLSPREKKALGFKEVACE
jgi:hypothetical protein